MLSLWLWINSRPVHTALISFMLILLATVLLWPKDGVQPQTSATDNIATMAAPESRTDQDGNPSVSASQSAMDVTPSATPTPATAPIAPPGSADPVKDPSDPLQVRAQLNRQAQQAIGEAKATLAELNVEPVPIEPVPVPQSVTRLQNELDQLHSQLARQQQVMQEKQATLNQYSNQP